ncbi:hypothetical protein BJ878DRAFT_270729 [Calycina marina]|uniref:Uncharacterized protein n=1 Tax=Calycina marina TaxID=1763456 RepID=A0A9P7YWY4_9HELO|nr:hypothetical protein BJ878DRAFT_270729 [Calycina marina]
MPQLTPLYRLLTPLLQTLRSPPTLRSFSTTSSLSAGPPKKKVNVDPRITLIRYHLQHPKTPRPLKLSRLRGLRHWTIHRAWMLMRRKREEKESAELYRMYQSMSKANELLRTMDPPGMKDAGRLYRIAQEKKGIFGHGGVPIEYARWQTDTPGREPWNHGWTR